MTGSPNRNRIKNRPGPVRRHYWELLRHNFEATPRECHAVKEAIHKGIESHLEFARWLQELWKVCTPDLQENSSLGRTFGGCKVGEGG